MAEVFVEFTDPILDESGNAYTAQACGRALPDGLWEGWIEFIPRLDGDVLRSGRETTQPNRQDLAYWATGLTAVYLEGALHRAQTPRVVSVPPEPVEPVYDGPAPEPSAGPAATNSVLNPFSVYRKGDVLLRRQLAALSGWHLVNIIRAHNLSQQTDDELAILTDDELIELIVAAVRVESELPLEP